jgi:UDP-GlcNAc:undecaprenyl-phosphate GlcNAc-1-phosphate transferase
VGLWDDFCELSWKIQLFFQIFCASLVFFFGVRIYYLTNPFLGEIIKLDKGVGIFLAFFLALIWIVLLMNALNWLDGLDGLSGGITLIGVLTIFFLSLKEEVNQPPVAIITMILAGSILAFLIFNFNPAKIMAGTAGSMFMGFSLAVLAIFSGTKIATTLLILAIPVLDFLWVVWERKRSGKSIFLPDNNHLHYKLLSLGWSQRKINISLYLITAVIAAISLHTRVLGKSITLLLVIFFLGTSLFFLNKITSQKVKE